MLPLLYAVLFLLYEVVFTLYSVQPPLHVVLLSLYDVDMSLYYVHLSLYEVLLTLYAVVVSLYAVVQTLYAVVLTLYAVNTTIYYVLLTLYTVHSSLCVVFLLLWWCWSLNIMSGPVSISCSRFCISLWCRHSIICGAFFFMMMIFRKLPFGTLCSRFFFLSTVEFSTINICAYYLWLWLKQWIINYATWTD